jgi:transcriptional regulator with XRE-family HTH domain
VNLKEWRISKGLTQLELAALLRKHGGRSVEQQHVSKWEAGTRPRIEHLIAIEKATRGRVRAESFLRS